MHAVFNRVKEKIDVLEDLTDTKN